MQPTFRAILLITALAAPAFSQASNGSVRGTVTDPADAVVPGAKITLTNTATNIAAENTTNLAGFYVFPAVVPGTCQRMWPLRSA